MEIFADMIETFSSITSHRSLRGWLNVKTNIFF